MRIYSFCTAVLLLFLKSAAVSGQSIYSEDQVTACFEYEYTLQVVPSLANDNLTALEVGMMQMDAEGKQFLEFELLVGAVDVQIHNVTSTTTGTAYCPIEDIGSGCASVTCQVCVEAGAVLDLRLVRNLIFSKTQKFISQFNVVHAGSITVTYQWPINVRTTLVIYFTGVKTYMNTAEQARLVKEIQTNYDAVLQQTGIGFDLQTVKIVLQGAALQQQQQVSRQLELMIEEDTHNSRQLATTSTSNPMSGNSVEMVVSAYCRGNTTCNDTSFEQAIADTAPTYVPTEMLANLREGQGQSTYFNRVDEASVGNSTGGRLFNINATAVLDNTTGTIGEGVPTTDQNVPEETLPWWIWILIGASAGVIVLGCLITYMAVQKRNKKEEMRRAYDTDQQQKGGGGGGGPQEQARGGVTMRSNRQMSDQPQEPNFPVSDYDDDDYQNDDGSQNADTVLDTSVYTTSSDVPGSPVAAHPAAFAKPLLGGGEEQSADDSHVFHDDDNDMGAAKPF